MGKSAEIKYIETEFDISELEHPSWETAREIKTKSLWSGQRAPKGRRFSTHMLWSDKSLYVRFTANQSEKPVIHNFPKYSQKTMKLWERDVCELFIAPNIEEPEKYFEFEVAPTGEWLDLRIHQKPDERITDAEYQSGMTTYSLITRDLITSAFKVEWEALGKTPIAGERWKGNILRAVGRGPTRGFLAWSATRTKEPNFHVPDRFGDFNFVK